MYNYWITPAIELLVYPIIFDYIDYWSVGHLQMEKYFIHDYSFRTQKNPIIKTRLNAFRLMKNLEIVVHVIDIYGKQSIFTLS